jgi:hypothetical protein
VTTLAPQSLTWLAREWERAIFSASFSGIVGDSRHAAEGGYHISREDQTASNYSVGQYSDDQLGRPDLAAAIDVTMNLSDMMLVTGRLATAWSRQDPRLEHVRAFNGTCDGIRALRWDVSQGLSTTPATDDHLWHVHLEVFRRWADDMDTARAILSVVAGTTEGDTMALTGAELQRIVENVASSIARGTWEQGFCATTFDKPFQGALTGVTLADIKAAAVAPAPVALTDAQVAQLGDRLAAGLDARIEGAVRRVLGSLDAATP